uniref:Uncharacterized protein n=1 Tax=Kwoniella pini CBS 10737 TaxID=1296096 RepID=A0A1B9I9I9_9TREE|nr:uncharacterized protein I206_01428 [Kwoniella pini CBS 10737]OCF52143.1 hypothetical protein I206_01428 [Kwoniella pini CBS 10737]
MSLWQSSPMHWQTYTTSAPLTPQSEEAFRKQASLAFRNNQQTIGYSVSSSFTNFNGITSGSTQLKIGKSSPWTIDEINSVERYLIGLIPKGDLIGPSGRPVGLIEPPHTSTSSTLTPRVSKSKSKKAAPPLQSFPSTISEAGTISPSTPPTHMVQDPTSPRTNHVHYEDLSYHAPSGRFAAFKKKLTKKTTQTER